MIAIVVAVLVFLASVAFGYVTGAIRRFWVLLLIVAATLAALGAWKLEPPHGALNSVEVGAGIFVVVALFGSFGGYLGRFIRKLSENGLPKIAADEQGGASRPASGDEQHNGK